MSHDYVIVTHSWPSCHVTFLSRDMTHTLHDLYDSQEYPYKSRVAYKYLC